MGKVYINGTRRTMQDTFPNFTKTILYNITHTTLNTPSPSTLQFTSYDTNSHETRTNCTYMTSQHHK